MIRLKKLIWPLILGALLTLEIKNIDTITEYVVSKLDNTKEVVILDNNKYHKDASYKFVQETTDFVPYSYHDLLNIIYTVINNGWNSFTFYCPREYSECLSDIKDISANDTLLTQINNYANPFNSFSSIQTLYDDTGEITIKVTKTYTDEEITLLNDKVTTMLNTVITDNMTLKDKLLAVHDYIINNTKYDTEKNNNGSSKYHSNTAIGVFMEGHATCNGYADAYALALDKLGVKNYKVSSNTHIWNAVYFNDTWLHIDLTWDDPVSTDGKDYLYHKYFLVNNEDMKKEDGDLEDHIFDKKVFQEFMD